MLQTKKRSIAMDAAKAICVLLVIYGHTFRESMRAAYPWCDFSYDFVYRFHVSTLFFLSGMGYTLTARKNHSLSVWQYWYKKARSLLLPWLSYAVLVYLIFALAQLLSPVRTLLAGTSYSLISPARYLLCLLRNENPYSFHLWYLQTLFLFVVVTDLLDRFLPESTASRAKLAFLLLVPGFYFLFCQSWIWTFKGFFQQYSYFLAGTLLPREKAEQHTRPLVLLGLGCGAFTAWELLFPFALYGTPVTAFSMTYVDTFAIIGTSLGIWAACVLLEAHLSLLARFGQNSMLFYLYHQPFCCAMIGMLLYDKLHLPAIGVVAICMAAGLVVPYLIHKLAGALRMRPLLRLLGLPG